MKNLTVGKLAIILYFVILISNFIVYYSAKGNPFKYVPEESYWTLFTGLSIAITLLVGIGFLLFFLFENWNKKIF